MKTKIYIITLLAVLAAGVSYAELVGMWNFSEGTGENAYSEVGDFTLQRGTSQSDWANPLWYEDGLSGYCFLFENDKGESENDRDFLTPLDGVDFSAVITPKFTIDAWVKLNSLPVGFSANDPYYVVWAGDMENVTSNNYFIRMDQSGLRYASFIGGFYYDDNGTPTYKRFIHTTRLEPGLWYRLVFSYDSALESGNAKLWVNGELYSEDSDLVPITEGYTTPWFVLGAARQTGSQYRSFDGLIDQFRFYDHAVQDISELDAGDCNYPGTERNTADINGDCVVNIADFSSIAQSWLMNTDPTYVE
jgi:hypothetical protein